MNSNQRAIQLRLQPGQTLALGGLRSGTLFLAEGEVLLQSPPEWLGDTVLQATPTRVAAPAELPHGQLQSITAVEAARFHFEEAASPLERIWSAGIAAISPRRLTGA